MLRRMLSAGAAGILLATVSAFSPSRAARMSPAWLSIEAPVNPYDASTQGAAFLVHASLHGATASVGDVSGSAEGIVNGARRSIALRFVETSRAGVFAVRRQWPSEGTWLVRVSLFETSALVMLDRDGNVASARIPTTTVSGMPLPRPLGSHEVDSVLADAARRADRR